MRAALDSWAVLAWLDGADCEREAIDAALEDKALMSWVNVTEVGYRVARERGDRASSSVVAAMESVLDLRLPSRTTMRAVIGLKSDHSIAVADCFAIATAAEHDAVLLTGDPEILEAGGLPCAVRDVRA